MADSEAAKPGDEIPTIRFTAKKVDDSWKEEARREKEAAAKAGPLGAPGAPGAPGAAAARPPDSARPALGSPAPAPHAGKPATGKPAPAEGDAAPATDQKQLSPQEQQQSKIFMTFLAGLAQQALMQLGEMENPYTNQRELDLNGARYTIELLTVIQLRTQGNLIGDEPQLLEETIADLRMRYVELAQELQRQMAAQMAKGGPGGPGGPGGAAGLGAMPGPGRRK